MFSSVHLAGVKTVSQGHRLGWFRGAAGVHTLPRTLAAAAHCYLAIFSSRIVNQAVNTRLC